MIEVDSEKIGINSGVMGKWMKRILLAFVVLAFITARSVETADFTNGTGTNGWVVGSGSYVSPTYPSGVSRIEIEYAVSVGTGGLAVFARTENGEESQVAMFTAASTSAVFTFAEGTDFRSFRLEAKGGLSIASFAAYLFPSMRGFQMSAIADGVYGQDFDTLASLTSESGGKDWLNGITLPYWQAWRGDVAATSFTYNGGKVRTGGLYALATDIKDARRALGGYSSKDAAIVWGIAFTNDTDATMRLSDMTYFAQQWGFANAVAHQLTCSYMVTNRLDWITSFADGWHECGSTSAMVFGDGEGHSVPVETLVTYSPETPPRVDPGEVLMLKWTIHQAASGYSAMMAIDDLHVTFVRESRPFVIHVVNGGKMRKRGFRKCM